MQYIVTLISAFASIASGWLLSRQKANNDHASRQDEAIHACELDIAVLQSKLDSVNEMFTIFNTRLQDVDRKLGEVLAFKPLLEDAILSIRDLRRVSPRL